MPFCKNCGKELSSEKFCPNCGTPTNGETSHASQNYPVKPKKKRGLLIGLIATATVLVLLITVLIVNGIANNRSRAELSSQQATSAAIQLPTPTATMQATPTATPTQIPQPDTVTINLDYGEEYQCSVKDFDLPDSINEDDVTWPVLFDNYGVVCNMNGEMQATNIQYDPASKYNDPVYVNGKTSEGIVLEYEVIVGNGKTYSFNWSDSPRNMKTVHGYTYVATPEIRHCLGFTLMFGYDLKSGKITGKNWSVWVRENGTTWVYVGDISATEGDYEYHDIIFDQPIAFNELIVQAPKEYNEFSASIKYDVVNIVYDAG